MTEFLAAAVQMDTGEDKEENLARAGKWIGEAAENGADLIVFPETMNYMGRDIVEMAEDIPDGETFCFLSDMARKHHIWVEAGSIYETNPEDPKRPFNTTFLLDPAGHLVAKYRKLHMFDVELAGGVVSRESDRVCPGKEVVTANTPWCTLGLGICYDLRFGELFRLEAVQGAKVLCIPSNFTVNTGKDHWEALLRARAIENECYVIAPNQIGKKPKFTAYGNSLIVDPWGTVVARSSDTEGVIYGKIDLAYVDKVRQQTFTLKNRRPDVYGLEITNKK